jgi:heme-degrading monooxygenase HmoA
MLSTGDVVEFRAYRPVSGANEVAVTYEFADMTAFARWYQSEPVQEVVRESRRYCENMATELWGPSPVVPKPVRPA